MVDVCDCPPEVRDVRTILPAGSLRTVAKPVVLTICDCDRRPCTVNGCGEKVGPGIGGRCANGHRV